MPAWLALTLTMLSASITVLSLVDTNEAARTGRLRLFFWHVPGWGERERNPAFFSLGQALNYYRTFFFGLATVMCGAFFFEAIGRIF